MKSDIKKIIESGILEEYALGMTAGEDRLAVEQALADSEKAREAYARVLEGLEGFGETQKKPIPAGFEARFKKALDAAEEMPVQLALNLPGSTPSKTNWVMAASIALLIGLGGLSLFQQYRLQEAIARNEALETKLKALFEEGKQQSMQYARLGEAMAFIQAAGTQRVLLEGKGQAEALQVLAFWNAEQQLVRIDANGLSSAPEGMCYQLWADVAGEMLSVGVLKDQAFLLNDAYAFYPGATSLNITLEPDGGSLHATVSRLVVSADI